MWNITMEETHDAQNDSQAESLGSNGSGITTSCRTEQFGFFFYFGFEPGTMWGRITGRPAVLLPVRY